jgi:hypothetical protein
MKYRKPITILVICIAIISFIAASCGIFTKAGPGPYEYQSIRGASVPIYGIGLYKDMSSDVAIQGIAQDYVTLFIGVPLLLLSLFFAVRGSVRARFLLAGIINYFLLTYLFYLEIAMYNAMFLAYVTLLGTSFFSLLLILFSFDIDSLSQIFKKETPVKITGGFLIFSSITIGLLWLSVIVPPLLNGTIVPAQVQHYTTLTVQGLDLGLFLPISFVSGFLLIKKDKFGYLAGTVTLVFLPLLMTALVAKLIGMASTGVSVIPAIFIIPGILIIALICCFIQIKNIKA